MGRRGVMRVTLVVDPDDFGVTLSTYKQCMDNFSYKVGNSYAEYREGDKTAKYGLTALVAGGAAAVAVKSGFAKYIGKLFIFIAIGALAFIKKLFQGIKSIFIKSGYFVI